MALSTRQSSRPAFKFLIFMFRLNKTDFFTARFRVRAEKLRKKSRLHVTPKVIYESRCKGYNNACKVDELFICDCVFKIVSGFNEMCRKITFNPHH